MVLSSLAPWPRLPGPTLTRQCRSSSGTVWWPQTRLAGVDHHRFSTSGFWLFNPVCLRSVATAPDGITVVVMENVREPLLPGEEALRGDTCSSPKVLAQHVILCRDHLQRRVRCTAGAAQQHTLWRWQASITDWMRHHEQVVAQIQTPPRNDSRLPTLCGRAHGCAWTKTAAVACRRHAPLGYVRGGTICHCSVVHDCHWTGRAWIVLHAPC